MSKKGWKLAEINYSQLSARKVRINYLSTWIYHYKNIISIELEI